MTPTKAVQKKKKRSEEEKKAFPANAQIAVQEVLLHHKLSAEKIVEAIREDYSNVSEVAVLTAIGDLFRQGILSEQKNNYVLEGHTLF